MYLIFHMICDVWKLYSFNWECLGKKEMEIFERIFIKMTDCF